MHSTLRRHLAEQSLPTVPTHGTLSNLRHPERVRLPNSKRSKAETRTAEFHKRGLVWMLMLARPTTRLRCFRVSNLQP